VPTIHHGWPALLASSTAPVTGTPGVATVALTSRVAKVSGWLVLSRWLTLTHHDSCPLRLPIDALSSHAR